MLKVRLVSAVFVVGAAFALGACSSDPSPSSYPSGVLQSASPADIEAVAGISWEQGADGNPNLVYEYPLEVSASTGRVVADGNGDVVEAGKYVALDYVVLAGADGSKEYSTYDVGAPELLLFDKAQFNPEMWRVLNGAHVGAQIIFATLDPTATDGPYPTIIMAITVTGVATVLDRATGEAVAPVAGLPTVVLSDRGAPRADFTGLTMPTTLVVQPLIKGDGAVVTEGQIVTVHYTGWLWDGAVFDSSWNRASPVTFSLATGQLIDGFVQGLVGQTVGSQVLIVVPPELAYGDTTQDNIPPGSTLVFVVDILAAI